MLFLFCQILLLLSILLIIRCSSRGFTQKCACTVLSWFSSYLPGRSQQIIFGHSQSVETSLVCGVPLGSVFGPLLLSLYTRQLAGLIEEFCIDYHCFADDSELYSHLLTKCESVLKAIKNVKSSCHEIKNWMLKNKPELNEQKTEVVLCGPPARRESVPVDSLLIGKVSIPFSSLQKTLGVNFDSDLSFDQHVSSVVRSCFFHVQSLSKVHSYLTHKAANSNAVPLILSKLDCCNHLLAGLPQTQIKHLQAAKMQQLELS